MRKNLTCLVVMSLLAASPAWATLGGAPTYAGVRSAPDARLMAAGKSAAAPYTVNTSTLANGTTIREYLDPKGIVFAVSWRGASAVNGTLTFGIDTQANNQLSGAGATVLATDSYGNFVAKYSGSIAVTGFIDSGSNATFFDDSSIMQYNGFFAPPGDWTRNVVLNDSTGVSENVTVNIGNAFALLASSNFAFNNLTAYMAQTVDLGLPFFLGRRVYYGIDGARSAGGGNSPYVAYMNR